MGLDPRAAHLPDVRVYVKLYKLPLRSMSVSLLSLCVLISFALVLRTFRARFENIKFGGFVSRALTPSTTDFLRH